MYTQCPECASAFRVTAEILKQAGGKVRCGGCGNAFNALMYLSESRPDSAPRDDDGEPLPQLDPEPDEYSEAPPQAITPEQSEALLKTLDDLSGADIRLEDTGIEWRLMSGDDELGDDDGEAPEIFATGVTSLDAELGDDDGPAGVDELLEDSPTPIDEFLTKTPHDIDAPEVFANPEDTGKHKVDAQEVFDDAAAEMRFDDNTGLPDDFDFDSVPSKPPPEPEPEQAEPRAEPEAGQADLSFGDEAEWGELLDEVGAATDEPAPQAKAEAEAATAAAATGNEPTGRPDDEPADGPLDIDTQFDLQAEALGLETSGRHDMQDAGADFDSGVAVDVEDEPDDDAGETSIEEDLISAAFESERSAADTGSIAIPDTTGELEMELARAQALLEEAEDEDEDTEDAGAVAFDERTADEDDADDEPDDMLTLFDEEADAAEFEASSTAEDPTAEGTDDDFALLDDFETPDDDEPALALEEDGDEAAPHASGASDAEGSEPPLPEHVVPQPSEEEQTINMMIDEHLLSMAVEDSDGLRSTMVLREGVDDAQPADEQDDVIDAGASGPGVETIIMEGDFVRTALEEEALNKAADEKPEDPFIAAAKKTMRAYKPSADETGGSRRYGLFGGVALLALLLVGQFVHQSRAELATIPAVGGIIAPIYRAVGLPITPEWDVTGWRFEVSRGSTNPAGLAAELAEVGAITGLDQEQASGDDFSDPVGAGSEAAEVLTVYSRIGNRSTDALPYPLISVALVDRFEETIGSKVLQPGDYLTGNADPRELVAPGETFNAVMSIRSPAAEATGFKLNVCYRQGSGQLRCALEDFK